MSVFREISTSSAGSTYNSSDALSSALFLMRRHTTDEARARACSREYAMMGEEDQLGFVFGEA